jgi:hypothetical protein
MLQARRGLAHDYLKKREKDECQQHTAGKPEHEEQAA